MMRKNNISLAAGLFFLVFTLAVASGSSAQTTNISTSSSQAAAASQAAGTTNVLLYYFSLNVTVGTPSFTSIDAFTTSGTYIAADLVNIKLWSSNFEFFGGGTLTTIATLTTGLGPGTHTLSFSSPIGGTGQKYFWITCDIVSNAICSDKITCDLITSGMYNITGSKVFGTNVAGGTQTIAGGGCQTMPIELLDFSASPTAEGTQVSWSTATETFNDYFTVERSADGKEYAEVARVKGAGSSLTKKDYAINDAYSGGSVVYYRLKQTDYNGDFKYFQVVSISRQASGLKMYPNPSSGIFFLEANLSPDAMVRLVIVNAYGQTVKDEWRTAEEARRIDISSLGSGGYFVKLASTQEGNLGICRIWKD